MFNVLTFIITNLIRFTSGFQYIALEDGQINGDDEEGFQTMKVIVFSCRLYGFLISLLGTLICIVTQEYLRSIEHETIETQVRGILRYASFFKCADLAAAVAAVLLATSVNVLLWNESVPKPLAYVTNIITLLVGSAFIYAFFTIIVWRQRSRMIYDDPNFIAATKKQ